MTTMPVTLGGLTSAEAKLRLAQAGANIVGGKPPVSALRVLGAQFTSLVVWFLLVAAAASAAIGEVFDALAIVAIVLLNAVIGFAQEFRAERAIEALRAMTAPRARVRRDGRQQEVDAAAVVEGDVLFVQSGDIIAADGRLVEAYDCTVNEAALTGESVPVRKRVDAQGGADGLVYMGCPVVSGSAVIEVTGTGARTELGGIARLVSEAEDEETPLRRRVAQLTRTLVAGSCGVVLLIAVVALLRGSKLVEIFPAAVSLAVAAIPEGLPAVVTVALALGVRRMARRNVLVRKLEAVEALGCTTVICTDKTGTLTTGVMTLREVHGQSGHDVLAAAAACCDAELAPDRTGGFGDATEVAIIVAAAKRGIDKDTIERENPRVVTHAFDDKRRLMSVRRSDGKLYVKGAVESVLPRCTSGTAGANAANVELAARGLRVLAVAIGATDEETDLTFVGLVGIADPPRADAIAAIAEARRAGIATVMITGDHVATAHAIAAELGIIATPEDRGDLVHARATPLRKLELVRAHKDRGAIVAMTGDGVNDAPALREASIGIAMGKGGTAVAREAADVVLVDDNFASIVHAIREGRGIFDAIRRAVVYLLSGNVAELGLMLIAACAAWPLPLAPVQLLWINLVTDGLPALALLTLPARADIMTRQPRRTTEALIDWPQWRLVALSAAVQTTICVGLFAFTLARRGVDEARSLTFGLVVACEVMRALAGAGLGGRGQAIRPLLPLLGVVALSLAVQATLYLFAATRTLFALQPITLTDAAVCLGLACVMTVIVDRVARKVQ